MHSQSSRFERIHAAAGDFTTGRSWPVNFASETGPKFIWDKVCAIAMLFFQLSQESNTDNNPV